MGQGGRRVCDTRETWQLSLALTCVVERSDEMDASDSGYSWPPSIAPPFTWDDLLDAHELLARTELIVPLLLA